MFFGARIIEPPLTSPANEASRRSLPSKTLDVLSLRNGWTVAAVLLVTSFGLVFSGAHILVQV